MLDNCSILVVDDDSESLALLTGLLREEGYKVRSANSGQLALASVAAWLPQLILLDIRMPDIDGFDVCRRIKASKKTQGVPLMFISAASEVEERVYGLTLGAVDYITKPFQREELLARIRTHLELGRLRTELENQVSQRAIELRSTIERLRESEERFRSMANTAPVMIWVSDADKLYTFFNRRWLTFTGRTAAQERGNGWAEGVHPDDRNRCFATYSLSFDARRRFQMEYRLRRADGEYRWVLDNGVPRFTIGKTFAGYIGSAIDITDLKRSQEEALSRQKLESLAVVTRGIAHDFNNLLGGILAEAELAEADLAEGLSPAKEIQHIKAVAARASEVIRELMIYSGQEKGNLEPVDLSGLVAEMLELLKVSISKRATLRVNLCEHLAPVRCNPTQIRQVVMNLIINASQALGDKDGVIHVRTSLADDSPYLGPNDAPYSLGNCVRLEISDTGCGMTEEEQGRIFDPFFTTKTGGHGLGLAVVQGIVNSHGGAMKIVSTPGRGTTFEVLLPSTEACSEITSPDTLGATADGFSAVSGTVLLVEDEDTLRLATAAALRKKGFSVMLASKGSAAVEIFRAHAENIGIVLLDLTLPGFSGLEVLGQIRRIKPDAQIMITSAHDQEIAACAATGEHPARFLRKPYRLADLMRGLQEARSEASQVITAR